jgi:hypothetical protein
MARDFKWLGSYRYGILHLGGRDTADLHQRCTTASALLGWPAPCPEPATPRLALTAVPAPQQPPQHQPLPAMPTTETST